MHETAAEERRLQAERVVAAEERKLLAEREAEEKRAEREAEETRTEREAEERKLLAKREAEERKVAMELERLKLELEAKRLETAARPVGIAEEVIRRSARIARSPELLAFVDGRDDLENYLLRFERYSSVAGWEKEAWAIQLSPLLSGRALEVYSRLSQDEAMDYERLKLALLKRYDFTEFRYRRRFRDAKPEGKEKPGQFIVRLKNYLTKWVKLAKVEESFDGMVELMGREQFTNACPKELSVYLNERSPKTLDELVTWAEQYLMPHNKKISSSQSRREDVKNGSRGENSERSRSALQCFRCGGEGHRAIECVSRMPDGRRREGERYERRFLCQKCGGYRHEARDCRSTPCNHHTQHPGPNGSKPPPSVHRAGCAVEIRELPRMNSEKETQLLELKPGGQMEVMKPGVCLVVDAKDKLQLVNGKVGERCVEVLRDTACYWSTNQMGFGESRRANWRKGLLQPLTKPC